MDSIYSLAGPVLVFCNVLAAYVLIFWVVHVLKLPFPPPEGGSPSKSGNSVTRIWWTGSWAELYSFALLFPGMFEDFFSHFTRSHPSTENRKNSFMSVARRVGPRLGPLE